MREIDINLSEPIKTLEKGHRVLLPRHIGGSGSGRKVGVIAQIIPAHISPLAKESAVVDLFRTYGNQRLGSIVIALDEISRERMHTSCPTCECKPVRAEPLLEEDEEDEGSDDDEDI